MSWVNNNASFWKQALAERWAELLLGTTLSDLYWSLIAWLF
jgi:hypothetical protein